MNPTVQLAKMWQQRMERWLSKRIPDSGVFRLDMSNIFIFPSHFGRLYLLLCIGLFILGSNYQNNLILIFCYFLVALFLVSLFSSFANFAHLKVQLGKTNSVFAGEDLGLPLWLEHKSQGPLQQHMQGRLHFRFWQQRSQQSVDLMAMENPVSLSLATEKRGWLNLPRITIECFYPFGLFRCWTHLRFNQQILIYPTPIMASLPLYHDQEGLEEADLSGYVPGQDDFYTLADYQIGDPLHRVAWKQLAKGQGMVSKQFSGQQQQSLWLKQPQGGILTF